ncbi:carbohydrate deacetylase [Desulfotomaculum copahuensis]|uniref:Carbohydrate deacetylase n=1 Tax=Desulfotomaculum copahuensis TaxID=1838280 RepID=A0A1B7LAS8_9FIRM|nr:carbohydrate deacetylase [Desulfotomaculum copahuensis]OAT79410.1 hypothetical protein A6M21_01380 [Desulfotomaculum copahuensis]
MLLIINADDLGYTPGVNRGIVRALQAGVVTSTSLMLNQAGTDDALTLLRRGLVPAAGVHLCLTVGRPLSPPESVPSLVDESGRFKSRQALGQETPALDDVRREFYAQVKRALEEGIKVTHLDTHHHMHALPVVLEALIEVAGACRLPVRSIDEQTRARLKAAGVPSPDYFCGGWFADAVSAVSLQRFISGGLRRGVRSMELMTHPGEADELLLRISSYSRGREKELALLCAPAFKQWLAGQDVQLAGFADICPGERKKN